MSNLNLNVGYENIYGTLIQSNNFSIISSIEKIESVASRSFISPTNINNQSFIGVENFQGKAIDEHQRQITKIQAFIRSWKARNEIFFTHQVMPAFHLNLLNYPLEKEDIGRIICQELNKMSMNSKKYRGKSCRLGAKFNAYKFLLPGKTLSILPRPFDLWLEMDKVAKLITILIIPNKNYTPLGKKLGEGNYKVIYRAQEFEISRSFNNDQRDIIYTPKVIAKLKCQSNSGLKIHREIIQFVEGKFTEISVERLPSIVGISTRFSRKQLWYNTDLHKAVLSGFIPLDFSLSPKTLPIDVRMILTIFIDVAHSLEAMHAQGYIHRDVKLPNILLKEEKGKVSGFLSDFDLTQKMGISEVTTDYRYWDELSRRGMVYPTTDNYGLIMCLGEALIPYFREKDLADFPHFILNDTCFLYKFKCLALTTHVYNHIQKIADPSLNTLKNFFLEFYNSFTKKTELILHYTDEKLCSLIENFLKDHTSLPSPIKSRLTELTREISVLSSILDLIQKVTCRNEDLKSWIDSNPAILKDYRHCTSGFPQKTYNLLLAPFFEVSENLSKRLEGYLKFLQNEN